ncbi:protein AGENET DOMAIN (AGD)-CONTAINING P1-like [Apium graveolens]|uniref:protein AGENET DOMAIN (AGD)-CONTAINING P1-like n=1 Tax=Apium graveolens TaxID=4045 RepID=UPI003D7B04F8
MVFRSGDRVEVSSKQDGFVGSYYEAVVIKEVASREYQVMYKNLVDEFSKAPLLEHVKEEELRPAPPKVPAMRFGLGEVVDAFDRDGWWAGVVVSQHSPATYEVYFDLYPQYKCVYPASSLRVHQDWINHKYFVSSLFN